jgi:hypothetical protein
MRLQEMTTSTQSLRIVVTGLITQHPRLGGITWHYLQYLLGLRELGHDVYYLEDSGEWPYSLDGGASGQEWIAYDCATNVEHIGSVMKRFGLGERWSYRFPIRPKWFGMSDSTRCEVLRTADLLLNVSGTLERPQEYRCVRRTAYVDSDPVFTQIKHALGGEYADFRERVDAHDVHFTFGERAPSWAPDTGHEWHPTRQPIVLDEWRSSRDYRDVYTTVMSWTSYKPLSYEGDLYAQKDWEFRRFIHLPARIAPAKLELAVNHTDHIEWQTTALPAVEPDGAREEHSHSRVADVLARCGWNVVDPADACGDLEAYRAYIASSKGEWSVAKNGYVRGQPGWFSERSACYLAAGRPVIVQNTGLDAVLPIGEGILAFSTLDEAVAAVREVESSYRRHARTARDIAEAFFDSKRVLERLLDDAFGERVMRKSARPLTRAEREPNL